MHESPVHSSELALFVPGMRTRSSAGELDSPCQLKKHVNVVTLSWWEYVPGGQRLKEYCDQTTLHGFRYFSETGRSLSERYYWLVVLLFVYTLAIVSVYDQVTRFLHAPVLMSLNSDPTSVWDIPFPALTICSENQVRPSYFNFSAHLGNTPMTEKESQIYAYINAVCRNNASNTVSLFSHDILDDIHQNIWKHCNDTIETSWMSESVENPCDGVILQPSLTPLGACHTFNGLPADRFYRPSVHLLDSSLRDRERSSEDVVWTPDDGYPGQDEYRATPPWRSSGGTLGLNAMFLLDLNSEDFDSNCFYGGHGFMVFIHSPADLPTLSHPSVYVHADHMANVMVIPELKNTEKQLLNWSPTERGCFFQDERPLKYFQFYTERNCDLECESNVTLFLCGCVPFFHPRTKETPVCGPEKQECFLKSISRSLDDDTAVARECNCNPSCSEIEYRVSVSHFQRNYSLAANKGIVTSENITENNYAIVTIQYQTQKVTAMMRVAVFSLSDFVANIGGLLGLFLGFSFISLFEIFYFLTLRFRKKGNKFQNASGRVNTKSLNDTGKTIFIN